LQVARLRGLSEAIEEAERMPLLEEKIDIFLMPEESCLWIGKDNVIDSGEKKGKRGAAGSSTDLHTNDARSYRALRKYSLAPSDGGKSKRVDPSLYKRSTERKGSSSSRRYPMRRNKKG